MPSRRSLLAAFGLPIAGLFPLLPTASAQPASAPAVKAGDLSISQPYARATAPGQPAGGAYLRVDNAGSQPDRLVAARADVAKEVQMHVMQMQGDVMRMRQIEAIDVPAKGSVELKPGGLHLMLMGLKGPLKDGERIPVTLKFEKAGEVKVDFAVQSVKAPEAGHDHVKP